MLKHTEIHRTERIGWLRAAVLGANDGIVSTASLIVGVASAHLPQQQILLSGIAGLVAGAMSMAAGEYVSVSSQADTEKADLKKEKSEIESNPEYEKEELAQIYVQRGLDYQLAQKVSEQLMAFDALGSHARDELGMTERHEARPLQAALASAAAFSVGALLPLFVLIFCSTSNLVIGVSSFSILFLMSLGAIASFIGGASPIKGALRVGFWGLLAMLSTALIGEWFGTSVPV